MPTYLYYEQRSSPKPNKNRKVTVWRLKNNEPTFIGEKHRHTASYKGSEGTAADILKEEKGYEQEDGGYAVKRKDVELIELK